MIPATVKKKVSKFALVGVLEAFLLQHMLTASDFKKETALTRRIMIYLQVDSWKKLKIRSVEEAG